MADKELPITGYLDRFSHRPGETFTALSACATADRIARDWCAC